MLGQHRAFLTCTQALSAPHAEQQALLTRRKLSFQGVCAQSLGEAAVLERR